MALRSGVLSGKRHRYIVIVIIGLLISASLAPVVWQTVHQPGGTVSVITIDQPITSGTAHQVTEDLREARQNNSIKAVVLQVNSPGGAAAASEALYLAVRKTAQQMPVVASVQGLGASGAYYAILPADIIYVTPASLVGSVGVRTTTPIVGDVSGQIATGPDKIGGRTIDETRAQLETVRRAFINAVFSHRGETLSLTREQVSYAKIYTGTRAVENGMADKIGAQDTAIAKAAKLAGLSSYTIVRNDIESTGLLLLSTQKNNGTVVVRSEPFDYEGVNSPRYLMLYGELEEPKVINNESR